MHRDSGNDWLKVKISLLLKLQAQGVTAHRDLPRLGFMIRSPCELALHRTLFFSSTSPCMLLCHNSPSAFSYKDTCHWI